MAKRKKLSIIEDSVDTTSDIGEKTGTFFDQLLGQLKDTGGLGGNIAGEFISDALESVLGKIAKIGKVIFRHIKGKIEDKHTEKTLEEELQDGDFGISAKELRNVLNAAIKEKNRNPFIKSHRGKFKRWLDVLYSFRSNDFLEYFSQVKEFQKLSPAQQRGLVEFLCEFRERLIDTQWAKVPDELEVVHASLQGEISELKSMIEQMGKAAPNGNEQPTLRRIAMLRECPNCGPGALFHRLDGAYVCEKCKCTIENFDFENLSNRASAEIKRERKELENLKSDLLGGFYSILEREKTKELLSDLYNLTIDAIISPRKDRDKVTEYIHNIQRTLGTFDDPNENLSRVVAPVVAFYRYFMDPLEDRTDKEPEYDPDLESNFLRLQRLGFGNIESVKTKSYHIKRTRFIEFLIKWNKESGLQEEVAISEYIKTCFEVDRKDREKFLAALSAGGGEKQLEGPKEPPEPQEPQFTTKNGVLTDWDKRIWEDGKLEIKEGVKEIKKEFFAGYEEIVNVRLPASLKKIGAGAFAFCPKLEKVSGGENVEIIEERAFFGCKALKSFALPKTLRKLGGWAFCGCAALDGELTLPKSLEELGEGVFMGCPAEVKAEKGGNFVVEENCLLDRDKTVLYRTVSKAELLDFEDFSLTRIAAGAAYGCEQLRSILLPDDVTVGKFAFAGTRVSPKHIFVTYDDNNAELAFKLPKTE